MAAEKKYVPVSGFARWLDSRLPIVRLMHDSFVSFPTPRNLNIWYTFGAILGFCLIVQMATGIVLAMHYVPHASLAFASVEGLRREVNYGWLIRGIHATGASMLFVALYIHIFRSIYYGSYKAPREIVWILGVILYILLVATSFLGYVLPWGQMSFWGATVITSLFGSIPVVGGHLTTWLWGDYAVGDATLTRFFSLHYLLPFVIAGVVGLHIWALHVPGNGNPLGIDVKGPQDTVPFHPYYTVKDILGVALFAIVFAVFVFYAPDFFNNPDNYTPANPMVTPSEITPEWYLLPYYAMLRAIPQKLIGAVVLAGAFLSPFLIPWLDTSKVRSCRFRPMMKWFFWAFAADCVLLGLIGAQSADAAITLAGAALPLVWVGRLATLYFLAFFWVVMPVIGKIEIPKPLPDNIARPVLGEGDAP